VQDGGIGPQLGFVALVVAAIVVVVVVRGDAAPQGEDGATLVLPALAAATVLAVVHLLSGSLAALSRAPRSVWLSIGGGISIAYVFVHLLPELANTQEAVAAQAEGALPFIEDHVYFIALAGLLLFYGVERWSQLSRQKRRQTGEEDATGAVAFWFSLGSFAAYNLTIGYLLLHRSSDTVAELGIFTFAFAVHFVVNDHGLRDHHKGAYARVGRFLLAASVLAGWALGALTEVPDAVIGLLVAFIGGGTVLNVIKEELPEQRGARFSALLLGAAAYAAVLQFL
jgi:hypothetical protein